jgi:hypothetical protein
MRKEIEKAMQEFTGQDRDTLHRLMELEKEGIIDVCEFINGVSNAADPEKWALDYLATRIVK